MGRLALDRHTRRDLLQAGLALAGLGLLVGCGISLSPLEPPAKVARVGFLWAGTSTSRGDEAFRLGLRELGYVEGQNVTIERRFAEEQPDRLPDLAAELVRLNVDVIVAVTGPEIRAAREATSTIPIVMVTAGDPVAEGFVASLAHPGGNITGLTNLGPETAGKRLELL